MSTRRSSQIIRGTARPIESDKRQLQLELYDAFHALRHTPTEQAFTRTARMISIIRNAMRQQRLTSFDAHIQSAQRALDDIFDRWEDTDEVRVLELEKLTLSAATPHLAEAIDKASIRALANARDIAEAEMSVQGIQCADHPTLRRH